MNYIYDIVLNFNINLYSFYEWYKNDNIELYNKIPVFKVEDNTINDFINNNIMVDKKFLNYIFNKSKTYKLSNYNKYSCIFTSLNKSIAISFDNNGNSKYKSFLNIEEEDEVLNLAKIIKYNLIDYKIKQKNKIKNIYLTRKENSIKKEILNNLYNIYNNKEYDKLKYIFYELYGEKNNNSLKIYNKLVKILDTNSNKIIKLKNIFDKINV